MTWDDTAVDWDQIDVSWDGNSGGTPFRLSAVAGAGQQTVVTDRYPLALVVAVYDGIGQPVGAVAVTATGPVVTGGFPAVIFSATGTNTQTVVSAADGTATFAGIDANTRSGQVTVNVTCDPALTLPVGFTNLADVPAVIDYFAGNNQTAAPTGSFFTWTCVARDRFANGCAGLRYSYSVPPLPPNGLWPGPANFYNGVTTAPGQASAPGSTASDLAGRFQVTAALPDYPAVTPFVFDAEVVAGPTAEIHALLGTPQGAAVGTVYRVALVAQVTDQWGNGKPGETVTFTAPDISPTGTFPSGSTSVVTSAADGTGTAETFTADTTIGTFRVTATIPSGIAAEDLFLLTNLLARDPVFDDTDYEFVSPDGEGIRLLVLRGQTGRLMPQVQLWEQEVPGVPGYRFLGARHSGRELTLPCYLESASMAGISALRQLARVLDPTKGVGSLRVNLPDGTVRQIGATYAGGLDTSPEVNPNGMWAALVFRTPDPYWTDGVTQNAISPAGQPHIDVVNDGDYETWPTIRVTGQLLTNPTLTHLGLGQKIALAGNVNDLIVDCRPGHRSVVMDGRPNYSALSQDSELFGLTVGAQRIAVTAANTLTAQTMQLAWARRFLTI